MIIRKFIVLILLINFFTLTFEFNNINYTSNDKNSNQLLDSFIDSASLAPFETTCTRIPLLKIPFYSTDKDNSVSKLKLFSKSLQLISETESELNNRYSTFKMIESSTGT